jgi:hypothetical protein
MSISNGARCTLTIRSRWRNSFEPQSGRFESAGFQMLTEESVLRNGVSWARFRMQKPLDAAHT